MRKGLFTPPRLESLSGLFHALAINASFSPLATLDLAVEQIPIEFRFALAGLMFDFGQKSDVLLSEHDLFTNHCHCAKVTPLRRAFSTVVLRVPAVEKLDERVGVRIRHVDGNLETHQAWTSPMPHDDVVLAFAGHVLDEIFGVWKLDAGYFELFLFFFVAKSSNCFHHHSGLLSSRLNT